MSEFHLSNTCPCCSSELTQTQLYRKNQRGWSKYVRSTHIEDLEETLSSCFFLSQCSYLRKWKRYFFCLNDLWGTPAVNSFLNHWISIFLSYSAHHSQICRLHKRIWKPLVFSKIKWGRQLSHNFSLGNNSNCQVKKKLQKSEKPVII